MICAALWPDPADENCPSAFRKEAATIILDFAAKIIADAKLANEHCSPENYKSWSTLVQKPPAGKSFAWLRTALLDFIADFANWDNSTVREYLDTSRALTQTAHEALGGAPGTRPLVVDPFAGGGAIPLEVLRVGADAFASDLNPVPVLLNKVVLEYIPKYGQRLADEVRKWGEWIKHPEAEKELGEFYPKDADGSTPIAYLWARTIQCEGPGCGAKVPLIRNLWLGKKAMRPAAVQLLPDKKAKRVDFQIIVKTKRGWVNQNEAQDPKAQTVEPKFEGTVKGGSAICPCCDYTTKNDRVRKQLAETKGGASTATLFAVARTVTAEAGRFYRLPSKSDLRAYQKATEELNRQRSLHTSGLSLIHDDELIPTERPSPNARGLSAVTKMGVATFGDLFAPRQALALVVLGRLVRNLSSSFPSQGDKGLGEAVTASLALAVDRQADSLSSLATWAAGGEFTRSTFTRQALAIVWDFAECCPLADASGNWDGATEWVSKAIEANAECANSPGTVVQASATEHPLPNDAANAVVTDPPYYDAVPYADLSEFFYVWIRRTLAGHDIGAFKHAELPKDEEAIWNPSRIYSKTGKPKDERFYEMQMRRAFEEARRVVAPSGIGVIVFAHKSTAGWEAVLSGFDWAGWIATGSWPIDTEREVRTAREGFGVACFFRPSRLPPARESRRLGAHGRNRRLARRVARVAPPHPRMDAAYGGGRRCGRGCHFRLSRPGPRNLLPLFARRESQRRNCLAQGILRAGMGRRRQGSAGLGFLRRGHHGVRGGRAPDRDVALDIERQQHRRYQRRPHRGR